MEINEFIEEISKLNIQITQNQLDQLEKYYNLIVEYNKKMNLTGIIDKKQVYLKHFYDCICISKVIDLTKEETLCDVGSGAGFPGIVLKIIYPTLKVTLIDSLNKRVKFLKLVIGELNLKNIEVICARAEEYATVNREKYDVVTCRAVSKLNILLELCVPMVKENKYFIPLKGNMDEELKKSDKAMTILNSEIIKAEHFLLPIENSKRTILKIQKNSKTNNKYPRKYSEILKKSL